MTESHLASGRVGKQWPFFTDLLLLCQLLTSQPFNEIILKCYLQPHPGMEKWKGVTTWEVQTFSWFPLFLTFLSLFIDYVKALWKYEILSKWCSKWAVSEYCRENVLLPRTGGFLWLCNFPVLIAEGLIKCFRNVSLLFYLLEGKGYVNQPSVVHPSNLSFSKKQSGVI